MTVNYQIMHGLRCMLKLLEKTGRPVCEKYGISQTELDILAFLSNNPGKDTASDITEMRMLPKANVSQAVEALINKGFLNRKSDRWDRRKIHLSLTDSGEKLIPDIDGSREDFIQLLLEGFSQEERQLYMSMNMRISQNAVKSMEGKLE